MLLGKSFFNNYLDAERKLEILDVGSMNLNGTLRDVASQCWIYTGIDIEEGEGVDVILEDPHSFHFDDETFDAIVSTSCFEHDVMFWVTFREMLRVLKMVVTSISMLPQAGTTTRTCLITGDSTLMQV